METDVVIEKESKGKRTTNSKKKQPTSRFVSLGKDQTVSILHGVGRVLNPKCNYCNLLPYLIFYNSASLLIMNVNTIIVFSH